MIYFNTTLIYTEVLSLFNPLVDSRVVGVVDLDGCFDSLLSYLLCWLDASSHVRLFFFIISSGLRDCKSKSLRGPTAQGLPLLAVQASWSLPAW